MCDAWLIWALRLIRAGAAIVVAGAAISVAPLLLCGVLLIVFHIYALRHSFAWPRFGRMLLASIAVPFIEEAFLLRMVRRFTQKWPEVHGDLCRFSDLCSRPFFKGP